MLVARQRGNRQGAWRHWQAYCQQRRWKSAAATAACSYRRTCCCQLAVRAWLSAVLHRRSKLRSLHLAHGHRSAHCAHCSTLGSMKQLALCLFSSKSTLDMLLLEYVAQAVGRTRAELLGASFMTTVLSRCDGGMGSCIRTVSWESSLT